MVCLENIDLDTLISIIKKKKTVCFGAGLQGRRVAEFLKIGDSKINYLHL